MERQGCRLSRYECEGQFGSGLGSLLGGNPGGNVKFTVQVKRKANLC